jgi:hypothetical protein
MQHTFTTGPVMHACEKLLCVITKSVVKMHGQEELQNGK